MLDASYLEYRFAASRYLARSLAAAGWPVVEPGAAHAVYVSEDDLPGQSLACGLYLARGIRVCEIGCEVATVKHTLPAMRIVEEPRSLRHFTAALAPASAFPDFV